MSAWEREVSIEIEGRKYIGHFHIHKGMVHVSHGGYSRSSARRPRQISKAAGRNMTARISGPGAQRSLLNLNASQNTKAAPAFIRRAALSSVSERTKAAADQATASNQSTFS